jgi:hypothetical protein
VDAQRGWIHLAYVYSAHGETIRHSSGRGNCPQKPMGRRHCFPP